MERNEVVLVNENDEVIGTMEKLQAHKMGLLHRAFSVFTFNKKDEMLIHRRAVDKYHCGGLWSNTCCSHPFLDETPIDGAKRRLNEEMGFTCELSFVDSFIYKVALDNGLIEYEFDHIFVGKYDDVPNPNPTEVGEWKYISINQLLKEMDTNPNAFTYWFKKIIKERISNIQKAIQ
ncbi:MAG: isopentenyl-diphosphate Delta-isomerase [Brumimicrobium sp.]